MNVEKMQKIAELSSALAEAQEIAEDLMSEDENSDFISMAADLENLFKKSEYLWKREKVGV